MTTSNPYVPPKSTNNSASLATELPSTWLRNFKAIVAVSLIYAIICATFALARSRMPEILFLLLIAVSAIASAWANIQLGPRIGWDRGGLPVVMIVFFVALVAYYLTALLIGDTVYGVINPVTVYSPYQP